MAIVLDRAQRNAVYGFVVSDLSEAGDLALVLAADEINRARWLRRNFEQATQLLDQIGWEKVGSRERYEVQAERCRRAGAVRSAARTSEPGHR